MTIPQAMAELHLSRQRINVLIKEGRLHRFYIAGRSRKRGAMVPRILSDEVYAYAQQPRRWQPHSPRPKSKPAPRPRWWEGVQVRRLPPPPPTEEDHIVAVLVLTGIVDMLDVYRVANQRILAEYDHA